MKKRKRNSDILPELQEERRNLYQELSEEGRQLRNESLSDAVKHIFSLKDDVATHDEIRDRILGGGKVTGTNMCVLMLAILIASVGLNTNSTAVIIGAMLISPLMGSILAMAYGTISADGRTTLVHALGFLFQILISVVSSFLFFLLSPLKSQTTELLARTTPTFFDVIVAICGGLAGIIGQTRKDKANNIIPGVAIATALMPPLCTCGYSLANGQWNMLLGALYLFTVNIYFIFCSASIILSVLQIPKVRSVSDEKWRRLRKSMIRNAILIAIPSLIIGVLMARG